MEHTRKKRGTIRSTITKFIAKIEQELQKKPEDADSLEGLLSELKRKEIVLDELDKEMEGLVGHDALEEELLSVEEYKEKITMIKSRLERLLRKLEDNSDRSTTGSSNGNKGKPTLKLPRLVLDTFSGDSSSWQGFWAQFSSSVHENADLCKVDKFIYLRSLLSGAATRAISGLTLTEKNYDSAVDILTKRFGRRELVINAHMNKLLNIKPVRKSTELSALRNLYDDCEAQVRSLESMGIVSETYSALLCPILMKVVPEDIALEISRRQKDDDDCNITELLEKLRREIEDRERAVQLNKGIRDDEDNPTKKNQGKGEPRKNEKEKGISSAAALHSTTESNCVFCRNTDHQSENCKLSVEERRNSLLKQGRCFNCLRANHMVKRCRVRIRCSNCNRKHHKFICEPKPPENTVTNPTVLTSVVPEQCTANRMHLQTAQVIVKGNNSEFTVRCLLDSGSERSFIKQELARGLNLPIVGTETLKIHSFGNKIPSMSTHNRVKVYLHNVERPEKAIEIEAIEVPEICSALIQVTSEDIATQLKRLNLQVADDPHRQSTSASPLSIIIGTDFYWSVVTSEVKRINKSLVAIETVFGWAVHGPYPVSALPSVCEQTGVMKVIVENVHVSEEELIYEQLKSFWDLESLGITEREEIDHESANEIMKEFEAKLEFVNNRYRVSLPWKGDSKQTLADNRIVAKKRFLNLVERFKRDPLLYADYKETINEYKEQGIVEPVPEKDGTEREGEPVHYLPHRAVIKADRSTTKTRIVFDASSKMNGERSLNDCLHAGPNLNPDIFKLLLKFRKHKIAFCADIERAFLQIELAHEDRDVARFFWTNNPFVEKERLNVEVLRLTRVLFGVTSSPYLLAATIKNHLQKFTEQYPQTCEMLNESLYVDDLISGANTETEARERYQESRTVMGAAGFNLRKWQSNSKGLNEFWDENEINVKLSTTKKLEENSLKKVLGIAWNTKNDVLYFDAKHLLEFLVNREPTKRYILQMSGRIYDPVGILSPYTINVKILFQEIWTVGVSWDDSLPENIQERWEIWCKELPYLNQIRLNRYYFAESPNDEATETQLHFFCDASEKAYGVVVYLRVITEGGQILSTLVCSKNRVAPLKKITLPRLELMGALLASRLSSNVKPCFDVNTRCFFWTDSTIVHCWINGTANKFKPFVENRIKEIKSLTKTFQWSFCPGKQNPADLLTRGLKLKDFLENEMWWQGPSWLKKLESEWPKVQVENQSENVHHLELRAKFSNITLNASIVESKPTPILDLDKFSSLYKVLRITAWLRRFINNLQAEKKLLERSLSAEEITQARLHWIKDSQISDFGIEIQCLQKGQKLSSESKILDLNPFLDDSGILRVGGRLQKSEFTWEQKHPIILKGCSRLAELLITEEHKNVLHGGIADTLAQIRRQFWLTKGRQNIKKLLHKCMICKKFSAKSGTQIFAPLPKERLEETPPFLVCGVDFAGPLYTKSKEGASEKSYIALFTCSTTRAVHLELVSSLSAENFLLALKRFIARRGVCNTIFSDNAKTFKRAEKNIQEIYECVRDQKIQDFVTKKGISWKYIVERAPWHGGFWERLVRSTKLCLKKVLGKAYLTFEEMTTLLCEVEAVLNSRPLTFVYNNAAEPEPLTPAHFLTGRDLLMTQSFSGNVPTSTKKDLTKRLRYRQTLLKKVWNTWRNLYLSDLRSAHRMNNPKLAREFKTGEVVLVNDENKPRQLWKMGVIVSVFRGRDAKVRSCLVRTANGVTIRRPIQLLFPLEIGETSAHEDKNK